MDEQGLAGLLNAIAQGVSGYQAQKEMNRQIAFDKLSQEIAANADAEMMKDRRLGRAETERHNRATEANATQGNLNDIFMKLTAQQGQQKEKKYPANLEAAITQGAMDQGMSLPEMVDLKAKMTESGRAPTEPKRPPDFAGKYRGVMKDEKATWNKTAPKTWTQGEDQKWTETMAPFPEKQVGGKVFGRDIWPQAAQYGLNQDSLTSLLGIDPVTGAVNVPDYSEKAGYTPGWGVRAQGPTGGGQVAPPEVAQNQQKYRDAMGWAASNITDWEQLDNTTKAQIIRKRMAEMGM